MKTVVKTSCTLHPRTLAEAQALYPGLKVSKLIDLALAYLNMRKPKLIKQELYFSDPPCTAYQVEETKP